MFADPEISSAINQITDKLAAMKERIGAISDLRLVICFMDTPTLDAALHDLVLSGRIVSTNEAFRPLEEKKLIDEHGYPRTGENLKWALAAELVNRYEETD